ncbi:Panacea domain-containing protein [Acinetobacter sp. V89_4]|uniref:Panacea domain-containing protein n=1 Tax=Acinetobacter sp. V89_4 TaxID=3044232 RepID=UPI00249F3AA5|nr:Panacea domain-containing protein [Acinetobacter sp. V89_4]MDI3452706.1 Panacea domain-containing protein [Acinetobacter sp. V89_4]
MDNKLEKIMAYICQNYPFKDELSDARLTKMIYLTDWFSSVLVGHQATDIEWVFNHYGPYVRDISELANRSENFIIKNKMNPYGNNKAVIAYVGEDMNVDIDSTSKKIINKVIDKTKSMYFNDFIDYVYSTYPIKNNDRYTILNLPELAQQYKAL